MSARWEVILANGTVIGNVSDINTWAQGHLSLWLDGRRCWDDALALNSPCDVVISAGSWIAYRPATSA